MKKFVKALALTIVFGLVFAGLTGCKKETSSQLDAPKKGEEIAVITVKDYGEIKTRLFRDVAPKAVDNFVSLAKDGKYDGVPFHRVIKDFMIQGGDTSLNGGDGKSIYGDGFGIETNEKYRHYAGALSMARTTDPQKGQSTQFFIVSNPNKKKITDATFTKYEDNSKSGANSTTNKTFPVTFPQEVKDKYNELGGSPHLDMQYTVFGQVFEGLDIVNKIDQVPTNSDAPTTPVIIEKVEITKY